jgi:hypothetical protein
MVLRKVTVHYMRELQIKLWVETPAYFMLSMKLMTQPKNLHIYIYIYIYIYKQLLPIKEFLRKSLNHHPLNCKTWRQPRRLVFLEVLAGGIFHGISTSGTGILQTFCSARILTCGFQIKRLLDSFGCIAVC